MIFGTGAEIFVSIKRNHSSLHRCKLQYKVEEKLDLNVSFCGINNNLKGKSSTTVQKAVQ